MSNIFHIIYVVHKNHDLKIQWNYSLSKFNLMQQWLACSVIKKKIFRRYLILRSTVPFLPSGPWTAPAAPDVKSFIIYFVKASESNTCIKHVSLLFFLLLVSLCCYLSVWTWREGRTRWTSFDWLLHTAHLFFFSFFFRLMHRYMEAYFCHKKTQTYP